MYLDNNKVAWVSLLRYNPQRFIAHAEGENVLTSELAI